MNQIKRNLLICAISLLAVSLTYAGYQYFKPREMLFCGCCGEDVETQEDFFEGLAAGRKIRKIWFAGGTVNGIEQTEFERRIMSALGELSAATNTDFIKSASPNGAYVRVYVVTDAQLKQRWTRPGYPLILKTGNQFWYRRADPRWVMPVWDRLLEVGTMHEMGHRLGLSYPENKVDRIHSPVNLDVMSIQAIARGLTPADKIKFQQKLGKPISFRIVSTPNL